MFNSKFNTLLTVLLVVAIIAIIGIIGYFGFSIYNKYYINSEAQEIVDSFEQNSGNKNPTPKPENNVDGNVVIGGVSEGEQPSNNGSNGMITEYKGYKVIGTISIPSIDIQYPILEKETSQSLKIAVVYLYGPGANQVGNTVIAGHNYRNGLFFSNLNKLKNGDKIYITDTTGTKITYEVYKNFTAKASDTSFYRRDTAGKREITLTTCTTEYADRTIILAREV